MKYRWQLVGAGVLLAGILGVVLYITITSPKIVQSTSSQVVSISSSQTSRTDLEDRELIKTSVISISESIRNKDLTEFEKYVDKTALCSSVFDSLYESLKSFLGNSIKKDDVLKKCTSDISKYVIDVPKRTESSSTGAMFVSLDQLFSNQASTTLRKTGNLINALLDYEGKSIVLTFRDTGNVAKLTGFKVDTVTQKP